MTRPSKTPRLAVFRVMVNTTGHAFDFDLGAELAAALRGLADQVEHTIDRDPPATGEVRDRAGTVVGHWSLRP